VTKSKNNQTWNRRERVRAALERRGADRVPVFMWFHPETARRLARLLEIPAAHVAEAMGDDIRQTWVNNNHAMEGVVHERDGEGHTDLWGIRWQKEGAFNQVVSSPLAGAMPADLARYEFPNDLDALVALMEPVVENRQDFFIGVDVSPCVFELYNRLRGMEMALLDLVAQPDEARALSRRCADFSVALSEKALARYDLDWLWLGDDVAGQQCMMMSPDLWREMIKPELARVAAVGKAHGLPVAYHCCGALRPIIGDLIDIGITVLNPIQAGCPDMGAAALKAEFGANLSFMGGVDTQELLPNASALDVRRATEDLIEVMTSDGGGYILAASHTIPPETPDENIFALYQGAGISRESIFDHASDLRKKYTAGE
jgi:uroporphyrinogen decarboxylase